MGFVRSADLYIFSEIWSVISALSAHTCLSAGVIDLQDLYNQQDLYGPPESNMCDLYDLFIGMAYVRSA